MRKPPFVLFKNHHPYKLNKEEEIFTGFCKEKNHPNKLEYFCKEHNQLCCAACLCKLKENGDGKHKDCDVCNIKSIKDEKKNKLKENIKNLEDLENEFNENMKKLKDIFQIIEKDKEDLKLKVQNVFTKIRKILNEREDKLLGEIDNLYNTKYFNEDIIKKGEKLPKQIKSSLEKGKLIDKEWDNNNLYSYINDCINIENNIKNANIINENINKSNKINKIKIKFNTNENQLDDFLKIIKTFGEIYYDDFKYSLKICPINIKDTRKYVISGDSNNIITKTGKTGWMGTICEKELDKSKEEHKWKIKILKSKEKYIMVGIATNNFDIHTSSYDTCGWYLYCNDSTLYSEPSFNIVTKNVNLSMVKDEIVIVFNMKKGTLKFIINNEDKGYSYKNIHTDKPIYPAILLDMANDSVEILEC